MAGSYTSCKVRFSRFIPFLSINVDSFFGMLGSVLLFILFVLLGFVETDHFGDFTGF